jgi:hypothetical protein
MVPCMSPVDTWGGGGGGGGGGGPDLLESFQEEDF